MKLEEFLKFLGDATKVRILQNEETKDCIITRDVFTGWLGNLRADKVKMTEKLLKSEVRRFKAEPHIRHKKWKEKGLLEPLEPGEEAQYKFSDLMMTIYYTFYI